MIQRASFASMQASMADDWQLIAAEFGAYAQGA